MTKYKVGDQVRIVKPHSGYESTKGKLEIIVKAQKIQGIDEYAFTTSAWYLNDDIELVYRPDYK